MLLWMESGEEVKDFGNHNKFFSIGENRLSSDEIEKIEDFINAEIDNTLNNNQISGDRAYVPGWHSPANWEKTPLQVIYDKAYPGDTLNSAFWYGLITMQVIMNRSETWYAIKTQFKGRSFDQTVYWTK